MKITQIRENGDTEALSVTDIDLLIEKMKKDYVRPCILFYPMSLVPSPANYHE